MKNVIIVIHNTILCKWIPTTISKYPKYADAKHTPKTKKKKQQNQNHNHDTDHDHNLLLFVQSHKPRFKRIGELSVLQLVSQMLSIHIQMYHL